MTTQAAIVSLYGKKEARLAEFIHNCQTSVASALGDAFTPYAMEQVHGTIVGLERRVESVNQNRNFWQHRGRSVGMDVDGYVEFLRATPLLPFHVQIGGFEERDHTFTSDPFQRGIDNRPYDRSFVIWHDKVVMMGWPVVTDEKCPGVRHYPSSLDNIRRAAQRFGILHGYHRSERAVDNDLYFRIGLVDSNAGATAPLVQDMRRRLSKQLPLILSITTDDLFIVHYEDERLPPETTESTSINNSIPY